MSKNMIERIYSLIDELDHERQKRVIERDNLAARNLSLAITHMEDAALRVGPPGWYREPIPREERDR